MSQQSAVRTIRPVAALPKHNPHRDKTSSIRGEATRSAILENSARLFAEKGFDGTSLQDIANAMGLTRPAVYHYFRSKEDMLATLVAETSQVLAEKLNAIRADSSLDPVRKIQDVTAEIVRERIEFPERFRMLERSEASLPEPVAGQHLAARRAVLAEVRGVISEGIDAGVFRACDERLGALSLLGMCNWVAWWYRPDSADPPEVIVASLASTAAAMFARPDHRLPPDAGIDGAFSQLRQDIEYLQRLVENGGP